MEFHEFKTTRDLMKHITGRKLPDAPAFYGEQMDFSFRVQDKSCVVQTHTEATWELLRRPFYNVYPSIAPMLLRLNLNFDSSLIHPPFEAFAIRFPKDREPITFDYGGKTWPVKSILIGPTSLYKGKSHFDGIVLWVDFGEIGKKGDFEFPIFAYVNLPMEKGMTVEQALDALPDDPSSFTGVIVPPEVRTACVKLACTVCLIGDDSSLIEPDVLSKDRARYWDKPDPRIVERAKRRGKLGFNIGRKLEVIPHVRRPHPALYWVGPGRVNPVILMRKGSVVHKEVITKMPSGFQT